MTPCSITNPGPGRRWYNDLAEKYEISPDRRVYTFTLKKGVKWQKGFGEVTSEDVKFSMERVMDPKNKAPMASVWTGVVDRIETPNPYAVKYFLKYPDPGFLGQTGALAAGSDCL